MLFLLRKEISNIPSQREVEKDDDEDQDQDRDS